MSIKSFIKGWVGEAAGALAQEIFLDSKTYFKLNNVTLQTTNGTTQIDHVIVSQYGIFVVESKNMDGWIFGDAKSTLWTQNLYGKKYQFQNPIHQNYRHIKSLQEFLVIEEEKFKSIVMFWGKCEFKTQLPQNVMHNGYINYIKSFTEAVFSTQEVKEIVEALKTGMMPKGIIRSWQTRAQHLQSLQDRHSSTTTCPKCGKELVLRTAKNGTNAGKQFYGCTGYPSCRYARNI